jgi:hypothetical protein
MGVFIEICVKHLGGPNMIEVTDILGQLYIICVQLVSERHALERFRSFPRVVLPALRVLYLPGDGRRPCWATWWLVGDRLRMGNTIFGASVRSPTSTTKTMQVQGSNVSYWGFGNMRKESEGRAGCVSCTVQFEVTGTMG